MNSQSTSDESQQSVLTGELCPICHEKRLTLTEREMEIPYFGLVYLYSMTCGLCKYHKADVECKERHDPQTTSFTIASEKDLMVRVVKSGEATITIPDIITVEPGAASQGYITNIEGILRRMQLAIETARSNEEDPEVLANADRSLRIIQRALKGEEELKIIIDDPSGNSGIISDRAQTHPRS